MTRMTKKAREALAQALDMAAATIELHTPNGAQSQPAWPRLPNGDIDLHMVAAIVRNALAKVQA